MKLLNTLTMRGENNMSNDLFDKDGVWRGSLKQYYDFAKDIIEDALNNEEDEQFEEANIIGFRDKIINFFLNNNLNYYNHQKTFRLIHCYFS